MALDNLLIIWNTLNSNNFRFKNIHQSLNSEIYTKTHKFKYEHKYKRAQDFWEYPHINASDCISNQITWGRHHKTQVIYRINQNLKKKKKITQELWGTPHAYKNLDVAADGISFAWEAWQPELGNTENLAWASSPQHYSPTFVLWDSSVTL